MKMQAERKQGKGPEAFCVCPKCVVKILHRAGRTSREEKCANCGAKMVRKGSYHHQLIVGKKTKGKERKS
jgi:hypothetical protein